jgi:AraC-like DNA-binding protein/mannose-6-phosphate isomerase-like protein (cupin superfamily)
MSQGEAQYVWTTVFSGVQMDLYGCFARAVADEAPWADLLLELLSDPTAKHPRDSCITDERVFRPGEDIHVQLHHPLLVSQPRRTVRHSHTFFEMSYVLEGQFVNVVDGQRFFQEPGQLVVIRPDAYHAVWIESPDAKVFNIMIRRELMHGASSSSQMMRNPKLRSLLTNTASSSAKDNHLVFQLDERQEELVHQIIAEYYARDPGAQEMMLGALIMLLTLFARTLQNDATTEVKQVLPADILHFIALHYVDITREVLAGNFGYSPRHMSRILKEASGKTLPELVNQHRIDGVCRRLRKAPGKVTEAVQAEGFTDLNYFYRVFKAQRGMTFSEYRRRESGPPPINRRLG